MTRKDHSLDSESVSQKSDQHGDSSMGEERGGAGFQSRGHPDQSKPAGRPLYRRRQYLVDPKRQLMATARVSGLVLVLLVLVNLSNRERASVEAYLR